MEELDPTCTATKMKYTYIDISNFQINKGNALARIPAPCEAHGYSYLADADNTYSNQADSVPPAMPAMPSAPDYDDKAQVKRAKQELKHYQACANIKTIGIQLLEQSFPECLKLLKTNQGLLTEVTLKAALAHVLEGALSITERQQEYLKYSDKISGLTYNHQPHSPSLGLFFGELERL